MQIIDTPNVTVYTGFFRSKHLYYYSKKLRKKCSWVELDADSMLDVYTFYVENYSKLKEAYNRLRVTYLKASDHVSAGLGSLTWPDFKCLSDFKWAVKCDTCIHRISRLNSGVCITGTYHRKLTEE